MSKRRRISANDLGRELAEDREYQARLRERDAQSGVARLEEKRLMRQLGLIGVEADSISELVQDHAPLSNEIANTLLQYLRNHENSRVAESIVRALGAAGEAFDPTQLKELFERSASDSVRWAIANTFAELRPLRLASWLAHAVTNRTYGKSREMLALAVARTLPAEQACHLLAPLFDEMPGHIAKALGECGGVAERELLRSGAGKANTWTRKEIKDAITRIDRRIASGQR